MVTSFKENSFLGTEALLLPSENSYNPGQKSLGQYCNIHIFLSFLGSLYTVHPFRNFFAVLPPPTQLGKNSGYTRPTLIVCGMRGGVGPVWIGKRPRNAKVSQDFCPRLSEKEVGRKKGILSVFQACKSVFRDSDGRSWTCFKNSLETNDIQQKLWTDLMACVLFQRIT